MVKISFKFLFALTSVISSGCQQIDAEAKDAVYARFPGAFIESAFVSIDKQFLCGEVQPKDAEAGLFYARVDGKMLKVVGQTEQDFRSFLSTCGVSIESSGEMKWRIRWAQLIDLARKGLRPPARGEKSSADYAHDLCYEAMMRDGNGLIKTADTCSRMYGK